MASDTTQSRGQILWMSSAITEWVPIQKKSRGTSGIVVGRIRITTLDQLAQVTVPLISADLLEVAFGKTET